MSREPASGIFVSRAFPWLITSAACCRHPLKAEPEGCESGQSWACELAPCASRTRQAAAGGRGSLRPRREAPTRTKFQSINSIRTEFVCFTQSV